MVRGNLNETAASRMAENSALHRSRNSGVNIITPVGGSVNRREMLKLSRPAAPLIRPNREMSLSRSTQRRMSAKSRNCAYAAMR